MMDIFGDLGANILPKALGAVGTLGLRAVSYWRNKRSINAKKIDRSIIFSALLFYLYLFLISFLVVVVGWIILAFAGIYISVDYVTVELTGTSIAVDYTAVDDLEAYLTGSVYLWIFAHVVMAIVSLAAFYLILKRGKRMSRFMTKMREASPRLHQMTHVYIVYILLGAFIMYCLDGTHPEHMGLFADINNVSSLLVSVWWIIIVILLIRKTARYPYSTIKITMQDGEILTYDCHPQVCRIHPDYIRILKMDNKVITYERQIQKSAIQQMEFLSEEQVASLDPPFDPAEHSATNARVEGD